MARPAPRHDARQPKAWVGRPSLEYQHAFDFCAVVLQPIAGPIAVLASHPFYGRELMERLDGGRVSLFAAPAWDLPPEELRDWLGPQSAGAESGLATSSVAAAVWAEPEREGGRKVLAGIGQGMAPAARLYVLSSTPLRRFLPEWQGQAWRPARHPAGLGTALRWLRAEGWRIEQRYGFHGPRSMLWGLAARAAARWDRQDWVDRCLAAMRAHYVVRGGMAVAAPIAVLVAQKG